MPKRAHLYYLSALLLITACSVVPAENPYDETAALDIQKKGRVIGRVNLNANTSYTHDFDARPLILRIKDLSTGLYVLDEQGEAISYETRNSSAALPDDLLPVEGLDAAGTFEIELAAGEYSLFFDASENELAYYFDNFEIPFIKVRPGGTVTLNLEVPYRETALCLYDISGNVEGGLDGRNFEVDLIDADNPTSIPLQTITMSTEGRFTFSCLSPSQNYRVRVSGENYAPAVSTRVNLLEDARDNTLNASSETDPNNPSHTTLVADVGTLKLITLGELFAIDYDAINESRTGAQQAVAPYTPSATVPVKLASALILGSGEQNISISYRVLSTKGTIADYSFVRQAEWQALNNDATFNVVLNEESNASYDGSYVITVQLRLCFDDGDLEFCYASGFENLDVILDTEPPYVVSMELGGVNDVELLYLNCATFNAQENCSNVSGALDQQIAFRAEAYDTIGQVMNWAGTFSEETPATFQPLTTTQGLTTLSAETPAIVSENNDYVFSLWLADAAGNVAKTHSTPLIVDVTAPEGFTINANNDSPYTSSNLVEVSIGLAETEPANAQVILSNSALFTNPIYTTPGTVSWSLANAEEAGTKTIYAKAFDTAGNESLAEDTIKLDLTPPSFEVLNIDNFSNTLEIVFDIVLHSDTTLDSEYPHKLFFGATVFEDCGRQDQITAHDLNTLNSTHTLQISEASGTQTITFCVKEPSGLFTTKHFNITLDNKAPQPEVLQCDNCNQWGMVAFNKEENKEVRIKAKSNDSTSNTEEITFNAYYLKKKPSEVLLGEIFVDNENPDPNTPLVIPGATEEPYVYKYHYIQVPPHSVTTMTLTSTANAFFEMHLIDDHSSDYQLAFCNPAYDDAVACTAVINNTTDEILSYDTHVGANAETIAPYTLIMQHRNPTAMQVEISTYTVDANGTDTRDKTTEIHSLSLDNLLEQPEWLTIKLSPQTDNVELRVTSTDDEGNLLYECETWSSDIVEICILPITDTAALVTIEAVNQGEEEQAELEYYYSNDDVPLADSQTWLTQALAGKPLIKSWQLPISENDFYALSFADLATTITTETDFVFAEDENVLEAGVFLLTAQFSDSAGNNSTPVALPIIFDTVAPVLSINIRDAYGLYHDIKDYKESPFYATGPTVSLSILIEPDNNTLFLSEDESLFGATRSYIPASIFTDYFSDLLREGYYTSDYEIPRPNEDGVRTIYATLVDYAGNLALANFRLQIDSNPPPFTITVGNSSAFEVGQRDCIDYSSSSDANSDLSCGIPVNIDIREDLDLNAQYAYGLERTLDWHTEVYDIFYNLYNTGWSFYQEEKVNTVEKCPESSNLENGTEGTRLPRYVSALKQDQYIHTLPPAPNEIWTISPTNPVGTNFDNSISTSVGEYETHIYELQNLEPGKALSFMVTPQDGDVDLVLIVNDEIKCVSDDPSLAIEQCDLMLTEDITNVTIEVFGFEASSYLFSAQSASVTEVDVIHLDSYRTPPTWGYFANNSFDADISLKIDVFDRKGEHVVSKTLVPDVLGKTYSLQAFEDEDSIVKVQLINFSNAEATTDYLNHVYFDSSLIDGAEVRDWRRTTDQYRSTELWFAPQADGYHTVTACLWDAAGNRTTQEKTLLVDRVPPFYQNDELPLCTNCISIDNQNIITDASRSAHFEINLGDATGIPSMVEATILTREMGIGFSDINLEETNWLSLTPVAPAGEENASMNGTVTNKDWTTYQLNNLIEGMTFSVAMTATAGDPDMFVTFDTPTTNADYKETYLCAPQYGGNLQETCTLVVPPGKTTAYIGVYGFSTRVAEYSIGVQTDYIYFDNARYVRIPYVYGSPTSILLPKINDNAILDHMIFFRFYDQTGNFFTDTDNPYFISYRPSPICYTQNGDTTCSCPEGSELCNDDTECVPRDTCDVDFETCGNDAGICDTDAGN